jgi:iron complex outermembrane receptor protein
VLRGPQGTLFGRNTTGGAINVILRQPGKDFGGYAEVGYGRFDRKLALGSLDLPFHEDVAIKVSGFWQNDDGFVKNVTTGERLNDDDGYGVRIGARVKITPDINWNGSYAHIAANGESILNFRCNPANPSDCKGRFATTGLREGQTQRVSPYAPLVISGRKARFGQSNNTNTDIATSRFDIGLGDQTLS